MQKLIDKNIFGDESLGHWLSADYGNIAIITDFAMLESYTGDPLINFSNSFTILRKFISQFAVMKNNGDLTRINLDDRQRHSLIDWKATKELRTTLTMMNLGRQLDLGPLRENNKIAHEKLLEIESGIATNKEILDSQRSEIMRFCTGRDVEGLPKFGKRGIERIKNLAYDLGKTLIGKDRIKTDDQLFIQTFAFRYSISSVATMIIRFSQGSIASISNSKLRNDVIDNNYLACSTYWDGFMTTDDNSRLAHRFLTEVLRIGG